MGRYLLRPNKVRMSIIGTSILLDGLTDAIANKNDSAADGEDSTRSSTCSLQEEAVRRSYPLSASSSSSNLVDAPIRPHESHQLSVDIMETPFLLSCCHDLACRQ